MSRPSPLVAVVGLLAAVVLAGSVATIAVRAGGSGSSGSAGGSSASPAAVTASYYAALHDQDASAAFALLCPMQQTQGEGAFATTVGEDAATGTGIASFGASGSPTITGTSASVPGTVTLIDGQSVSIHVLLAHSSSGWQVCSSDLGGVLPGPGSSSGAASSAV